MPLVVGLLGPTNTGKTFLAMERMLEHATGMIGFPLRLLARENYDRVVRARGADSVALVTGEERIVPPHPRYWVCTVEALNLDLEHVAFTSLVKHDGVGPRRLRPAEVGQIAGRAGCHVRDGTFGATTDLGEFPAELIEAVEEHRFEPLVSVQWRNPRLSFQSIDALLESLSRRPPHPWLIRARHADDQQGLEALCRDPEILRRAQRSEDVRLLWEVCQVVDAVPSLLAALGVGGERRRA